MYFQNSGEVSAETKELLEVDVSHLQKIGKVKPLFRNTILGSSEPGVIPAYTTVIISGVIVVFCLTMVFGDNPDTPGFYTWAYIAGGISFLAIILMGLLMCCFEQNTYLESFQVCIILQNNFSSNLNIRNIFSTVMFI